jgi:hypothetical protein
MQRLLQLSLPLEPRGQENQLPPEVEEEVVKAMALILLQILEAEEAQEVPDDS